MECLPSFGRNSFAARPFLFFESRRANSTTLTYFKSLFESYNYSCHANLLALRAWPLCEKQYLLKFDLNSGTNDGFQLTKPYFARRYAHLTDSASAENSFQESHHLGKDQLW